MSFKSAAGSGGKKLRRWQSVLSSYVAAFPSSVGITVCDPAPERYSLTFQIFLRSVFWTKSFHVFSFACAISLVYSFAFPRQVLLSCSCFVRLYLFLNLFDCLRRTVSLLFHNRLLWRLGRFVGVAIFISYCSELTIWVTLCS